MSENGNRWDVDLTDEMGEEVSLFDVGIWGLLGDAELRPHNGDTEMRDFITELVHEIRRLETENIRLADAEKHRAKLEHSVIKLAELSKPQPFHMWVEK